MKVKDVVMTLFENCENMDACEIFEDVIEYNPSCDGNCIKCIMALIKE